MPSRPFVQADVFGAAPLAGNPVAVVLDAEGLSTDQMRDFTHWTNLSEATFVLPPSDPRADYRVRIFSPAAAGEQRAIELPFAGHPTLGTCHAWLEAGGRPERPDVIVQECPAGLVAIRRTEAGLAFAAPPLVREGPVDDALRERLIRMLGADPADVVDAQWVDNGPGWAALLLRDAEAVLALRPTRVDLDVGVVGPHPPGAPEAFEVRAFFPKDSGTAEDPVTGSLNASLAQWLLASGRAEAPYVARQGTALGRAGRVHVERDADGTVWIGGRVATCLTGKALL